MKKTLRELAVLLEGGKTTARALVEGALAAIADPAGEGARAFISVATKRAVAEADGHDGLRKQGRAASPYAGIPFGVKDLFDVEGEVTTAGSVLLKSDKPAAADCDVIAKLRGIGFVPLGRTNMTEFAYSGVGLNPHYGTPSSVYGRSERRIPGGSSSGSAVAVADDMVSFSLGTDTGGSCRIPAAFNGIVGFKPTASRISRRGVYPLSESLDSVGPIANSVECCAVLDGIMVGEAAKPLTVRPLKGMKIGILATFVLEGLAAAVAEDFERSVSKLSAAGADVTDVAFAALLELPNFLKNGGILAAEAFAHHKAMIADHSDRYDPRVVGRIRFGGNISASELQELYRGRASMISGFAAAAKGYDAIICPTVAIQAPRIAELETDDEYRRLNLACLRNTSVFNFLDACAISLPMHRPGAAPTGLMLARPNGGDRALLEIAQAVALS